MKSYKISNYDNSYIVTLEKDEKSSFYYFFKPDEQLIKPIGDALTYIQSHDYIYEEAALPPKHLDLWLRLMRDFRDTYEAMRTDIHFEDQLASEPKKKDK